MASEEPIPLTRGVFVRFTTDRLRDEGVPEGAEGVTMFRHSDGETIWRISAEGQYVDADEADFDVVRPWLQARGVIVPSLNGGWFGIDPSSHSAAELQGKSPLELWGHDRTSADFVGRIHLVAPGDATGCPVLWDRERQLKPMYFIGSPDHVTGGFPWRLDLNWPDPELQIDGIVTIDPERRYLSRKAAPLHVTVQSPIGDQRSVSADLLVPAYACIAASHALVDLFPSVSADDLDFD